MVSKVLFWGGFGMRSSIPSYFLVTSSQLTGSSHRPRSPCMATRPRNATFLQQGIFVGIPRLRRCGSKFRVLGAGRGPETAKDSGGEESEFVGKKGEEGGEGVY
jgi:hypothetical protein